MESKFSWTQAYRRSWEDESKNLKDLERKFHKSASHNRKSIIRHLLFAIDTSFSIEKNDYIPSVRSALAGFIQNFVEKFKKQNPLSIINFFTCKNKFEKFSKDFNQNHLLSTIGSENFSFLNCLKSGIELLKEISYVRELLIVTASINTRDSGVYDSVFHDIKKYNIKVNIISICGEVTIFKKVCAFSNGEFIVPLNYNDLECVLNKFTEPLECSDTTTSLVKLGFPSDPTNPGICTCHLKFSNKLYECPCCKTMICSLPTQCPICELQLVTSMHISKSYYYQYPLKPLNICTTGFCKKCNKKSKYQCQNCNNVYCEECGDFVQDELNFCIYC